MPTHQGGAYQTQQVSYLLMTVRFYRDNHYLLPILTTYVKKSPQELKAVLKLIKKMRDDEEASECKKKQIPPHLNPQSNESIPISVVYSDEERAH